MPVGINPVIGKEYVTRRAFVYAGQDLGRGQIFTCKAARNNEKLGGLGYMSELPRKSERYACAECGAEFVDFGCRDGHGKLAHRNLSIQEEERLLDQEERIMNDVAPLYLENTTASQKGL